MGIVASSSLAGVRCPVPERVRLRGDWLEWRLGSARGWREGQPAEGALRAFLGLSGGAVADGAFVAFARRYGVLGLTVDGLPGVAATDPGASFPPRAGEGAAAWFREPIAGWRGYADHAKAVLLLAAALRTGRRLDAYATLLQAGFDRADLLVRVGPDHPPRPYGRFGTFGLVPLVHNVDRVGSEHWTTAGYPDREPAARQRRWLGHHVAATWLAHGALAPDLTWDGGPARMTLARSNPWLAPNRSVWPDDSLFAVLAVHIAESLTAGDLSACEDCGALFAKARAPRPDQPLRCPACAAAAHRRQKADAARRRRARERAAATPPPTPKLPQSPRTPADGGGRGSEETGG